MFKCQDCERTSNTVQGLSAHVRNAHERPLTAHERLGVKPFPEASGEETPKGDKKTRIKKKRSPRRKSQSQVMPSVEAEKVHVEMLPTVTYHVENSPALNYCPNCGCRLKEVREGMQSNS